MKACADPELASSVMEAVRKEQVHAPDLLAHLKSCRSCRIAAARVRRMRLVWRELDASEFEVRSAVSRIRSRGTSGATDFMLALRWAPVGVAALVALFLVLRDEHSPVPVERRPVPASAPVAATDPESVKGAFIVRNSARIEVLRNTRIALEEGETARIELGSSVVELAGPRVVEIVADADQACGWRIDYLSAEPSKAREQAGAGKRSARPPPSAENVEPEVMPPAQQTATWERAARALKNRDTRGAEGALADLAASSDAATRDAAQLARAQIWISEGRSAEARPVLEALAASGATPLIRRRAGELLSGLAKE